MILNYKKNLVSFIGTSFKDSSLNVIKSIKSCLSQNYEFCEYIFVLPPYHSNIQLFKKMKTNKVKLIFTQKLENLSTSLNIAIKHSQGEFIARIDFDDFHTFNKIKTQVYFLKKNKESMLCGTNVILNYKNNNKKKMLLPQKHEQILKKMFFFNPIAHSSILIRKNFFIKNNLYNEKFAYAEDLELWMRGVANNAKYYNIQQFFTFCSLKNDKVRIKNNFLFNYYARKTYSLKIYGFFWGNINIIIFYIFLNLPKKIKQLIKNIFYKKIY